jgi:hypothetical protein
VTIDNIATITANILAGAIEFLKILEKKLIKDFGFGVDICCLFLGNIKKYLLPPPGSDTSL